MFQSRLASPQADMLCDALVALENREDAYRLLDDLCTIAELQALAQRFHVARMLSRGATYQEIVRETGASTATISRVNRCLTYGADGYVRALSKLEKREGAADGLADA